MRLAVQKIRCNFAPNILNITFETNKPDERKS